MFQSRGKEERERERERESVCVCVCCVYSTPNNAFETYNSILTGFVKSHFIPGLR
jgi:hypothetical protein